jgi:protein involved in polysaccharide export with SLBB domain
MHQIPLKRLLSLLLVSLSMAGQAQESVGVSAAAAVAAPAALPGQLVVAPATGAPQAPAAGAAQTQAESANNASGTADAETGNIPAPAEPASSLRKARAPSQFQQFVLEATGRQLPFYGHDLFDSAPYSADASLPPPADYVLGPGDEVRMQVWGAVDLNGSYTLDRNGQVTLPKVGVVPLAGVPVRNLEAVLRSQLGKVFTNFELNASLGRLRSIQVYVVGQAQQPGAHKVSSLSTLVNALFASGGPSSHGSMRNIQLKRSGRTVTTLDLYDFIANGNKAQDVPLQSGDVIVIPPAGPRVAVTGTFDHAAIYELKPGATTLGDILGLGGGVPALASNRKALLERITPEANPPRQVQDLALDADGLKQTLRDGDIVTLFAISPQFGNAVTLLGNVASPMRYPYVAGMRVSDLVSNNNFLVPVSYWLRVNSGAGVAGYSSPEVNLDYATIQRLDPATLRTEILPFNLSKALLGDAKDNLLLQPGDLLRVYGPNEAGADTLNTVTLRGEVVGGVKRFAWRPGFTVKDIIPSAEWLVQRYNYWQKPSGKELQNDINWDYAQIIRRVPETLETKAITFNLRQAVLEQNPAQNIAIEPGDQITLYTTNQLALPLNRRIQLVTLAGEIAVPGVYQTLPGETLPQLLQRVGGLTPQAYVFGTELSRTSVRARQQDNLAQLVRRLEGQLQAQVSTVVANLGSDSAAQAQLVQQQQQAQLRSQIERLKSFQSNGRLALELDPQGQNLAALPALPLEDGDRILVPATPGFVSAFGSVNNENVFIYKPGKTVGDVIKSAGLTEDAEPNQAFVLRADGSIVARRDRSGFFGGGFESLRVMPGDTIVVPAQIDRESRYNFVTRALKDWTQIFANFGLGVAAIKSIN